MNNRIKIPMLILLMLLTPSVPAKSNNKLVLTFGIYTSDKPSKMVRQFRPILNELEQAMATQLGQEVTIKTHVAPSYEQGLQNLVDGRVDFSRVGPASYVLAKKADPAIDLVAMELKKGQKEFYGVIVVAQDSPIKTISDLKGKRFAFGDQNSTIGRYLSQQYLLQHKIHAKDLAAIDYLERHDAVGAAVASGLYHAGALKRSTFEHLVKKGHKLRELARFSNVTKPWVAKRALDPTVFAALKKSLLALKDSAGLKQLKKSGFADTTDQDFAAIHRAIEDNASFFQ
ncbi:MAG: PhnD/SsuA/transferrin family substrate-binding protein [Gammaproteobacteria bacterium]|nr:PhnD/SsuA/transferrin family substrate-binding protein [Gammaproteobacteria bacterium]MDH5801901.1 PhnD/SsuA/transferrin family substrate-binding protein [Gammaproteobacteria bacterium]